MEARLNTEHTDWSAFPYLENAEDVISVQRGPKPGGIGGAYRAFGETLRGLRTTFGRVIEGPVTIQYPEEKTPSIPGSAAATSSTASRTRAREVRRLLALRRGLPGRLHPGGGCRERPENRISAGERYAEVYEINLSRCIFCGYCEVACPFDAITMGHDYEMSDYNRSDLIFTKEMLLAEPIDRTPLRMEGE